MNNRIKARIINAVHINILAYEYLTHKISYACQYSIHINEMERYSRGSRGRPAKALVRETVARVQIPLSPPFVSNPNPCGLIALFYCFQTKFRFLGLVVL